MSKFTCWHFVTFFLVQIECTIEINPMKLFT